MKKNYLKNIYSESFNYIFESRNYFYFSIILFFVSSLIGFILIPNETILNLIRDFIQNILSKIEGKSAFGLVSFIFFNNLQSSFIGMISGLFLGIPTLFITILNGYILGFVGSLSVNYAGFLSLWKIVPHGIFELPALFLSLGLGFRLAWTILSGKYKTIKSNLINSLKVFIFVVIPLLLIAAIIEGLLIFYLR